MTTATPEPQLEITRRLLDETLILKLEGKGSVDCLDELEQELDRAAEMKPQHLLIDVTHLESVAVQVNGTLSIYANKVRHNGGSVHYLMRGNEQAA